MSDDDAVPAAARLVRDFVNTYEPQIDEESLTSSRSLAQWLADQGLVRAGVRLTTTDLATAIAFREGLRAVLLGHANHPTGPEPLQRLEEVLTEIPVRLSFASGSPRLVPAGKRPLDRALAGLVEAIRQCTEEGIWGRLKACDRDTCLWAYYDASRNQARRWCMMSTCGSVIKTRRARLKARTAAEPDGVS
jgi:predicted RNA-binding Zn ribbon-like protein